MEIELAFQSVWEVVAYVCGSIVLLGMPIVWIKMMEAIRQAKYHN